MSVNTVSYAEGDKASRAKRHPLFSVPSPPVLGPLGLDP